MYKDSIIIIPVGFDLTKQAFDLTDEGCRFCCYNRYPVLLIPQFYRLISKGFILSLFLSAWLCPAAQSLSFNHLNTSNGLLSDQRVQITEDRLGRLWLATDEGINVFDGYEVSSYTQSDRSGIRNNRITAIYCDKKGTVWIASPGGVQYKEENSNVFKPVDAGVHKALERIILIKEASEGILVMSRDSFFIINPAKKIKPLNQLSAIVSSRAALLTVAQVKDNTWLIGIRSHTLLVDIAKQQLIRQLPFTNAWTFCPIAGDEWMISGFAEDSVIVMNIQTGAFRDLNTMLTTTGMHIGYSADIANAGNGEFCISTRYHGLYILDWPTKKVRHYINDAGDASSINSNFLRRLYVTRNRTLVVHGTGISYTPLDQPPFNAVKSFTDAKGVRYQNVVNCFIQDEQKNMWIGTNSHLLKWDRQTGISTYYPYLEKGNDPLGVRTIRAVLIDTKNQRWVGAFGAAFGILQPNGLYKKVKPTTGPGSDTLISAEFLNVMMDRHGQFLTSTGQRFYRFDPATETTETFRDHPKLNNIATGNTNQFFADRNDNWWFAQMRGLSFYDKKKDSLYTIALPSGIPDKNIFAVAQDSSGTIYAGGYSGVHIIPAGGLSIQRSLGTADGLVSENITGLLCDKQNKIWIIGNRGLARYDPANGSIQTFDAKDGVLQSNHKPSSYYVAPDGEIFIGSESGFNHFYPQSLRVRPYPLHVFVTAMQSPDSLYSTLNSAAISLPYHQNNLVFQYLTVDFKLAGSIQYRYRLTGFDTSYVSAGQQRQARYTNLQAGNYTFTVEASVNGRDWYITGNPLSFTIRKAVWNTWWFRTAALALLLLAGYSLYRYRIGQINKEARLRSDYEIKLNELENSALRTQMNPHFIFNSLNTINSFVNSNDRVQANQYISKFSKLIRLILNHSREKKITLKDELEVASLYIQLEQIRFENKFHFTIGVNDIDTSAIEVPPLIIQPFVENAILHGLLPAKREGELSITLRQHNDLLYCSIEDNGIGREAARQIKERSGYNRKSHGMEITLKRIELFNKEHHRNDLPVHIINLYKENGEAGGTRVEITLVLLESF